jgi:hypothetical protein
VRDGSSSPAGTNGTAQAAAAPGGAAKGGAQAAGGPGGVANGVMA